ncbi:WG repeat-containing protein [Winogradskyella immobilis]|uniref:WG repeat-containing protein n=1 Tax=Winogradskyella immobilis TaxID=2816852 RepID=A0ABS8ENX3_9FLAO|nr:WG repeat-containing protein [Winogradskyella immobilis]MCC1484929.1 WG repeat-containing protein [Winogradskyella immobilis]MCG0017021.1 WG repeat-containing protein [Winogradskyella immobilis]
MKNIDFGKRLVEVRTSKGLTQEDVSELCNVTARTIQRIESGAVTPRMSTVKIIAEALDIDLFENVNKHSELKKHTFFWYLKDLFNLKTHTMRKLSVLSGFILFFVFAISSSINTKAQSQVKEIQQNITSNKKITTVKNTNYNPDDDELVLTKEGSKLGMSTKSGKVILQNEYDHIEAENGYIFTKKGNKYGLVYQDGRIIARTIYDDLQVEDNFVFLKRNNKSSLRTFEGKIIIPDNEYDAFEFTGGNYIRTIKNNRLGLINLKGKVIVPNEFDNFEIAQNYVLTLKNNKQGLMNLDGETIIPCEYDILEFGHNTIATYKNNRPGIIDLDGKVIIPNEYDSFEMLGNYHYLTKKGNKYGLINLKGEIILSSEYDEIEIEDGNILTTKNDKTKIIDLN